LIDGQLDQIGARLRVRGGRYLAYPCIEDAARQRRQHHLGHLPDDDAADPAFRHIEIHLTLSRPRKAKYRLADSQHLADFRLPAGNCTVVIGSQRGVARLILCQLKLLFRLVARCQRGSIRIPRLFQLQLTDQVLLRLRFVAITLLAREQQAMLSRFERCLGNCQLIAGIGGIELRQRLPILHKIARIDVARRQLPAHPERQRHFVTRMDVAGKSGRRHTIDSLYRLGDHRSNLIGFRCLLTAARQQYQRHRNDPRQPARVSL
jgi:hypothetical protein